MQKKIDAYKEAGVDTELADGLVDWLQEKDESPKDNEKFASLGKVLSGIGGFAGLFEVNLQKFKNPVFVSSTDGVGTKLLLGIEHNVLEGLGVDLVAMCVNDLYTSGAVPLFFLDYFATGKLDREQFKAVLTGIKKGLSESRCHLLGGETAELPGLYHSGHFDLAGFVVGIAEKERILGSTKVKEEDQIYGLASTGFHSNGYSLIRKWLADKKVAQSKELITQLMQPTKIYGECEHLLEELPKDSIHAFAHITGGGISGNLPRVIPAGLFAGLSFSRLPIPSWMKEFIESHGSSLKEVEPVFNLGVGMIAIIDKKATSDFETLCTKLHLSASHLGEVIKGQKNEDARVIYY